MLGSYFIRTLEPKDGRIGIPFKTFSNFRPTVKPGDEHGIIKNATITNKGIECIFDRKIRSVQGGVFP